MNPLRRTRDLSRGSGYRPIPWRLVPALLRDMFKRSRAIVSKALGRCAHFRLHAFFHQLGKNALWHIRTNIDLERRAVSSGSLKVLGSAKKSLSVMSISSARLLKLRYFYTRRGVFLLPGMEFSPTREA